MPVETERPGERLFTFDATKRFDAKMNIVDVDVQISLSAERAQTVVAKVTSRACGARYFADAHELRRTAA